MTCVRFPVECRRAWYPLSRLDHGFLIARFSRSVWVYRSMLVKCGLLTVQVAIAMSIKIRTSLIIVFTTFESNSTRRHGLVT